MKEQLYTLLDEAFYVGLKLVDDAFKEEGVKDLTIVGGTATQAHILDLLSEHGKRTIDDLVQHKDVSARETIRPTDDYDLACSLNDNKVIHRVIGKLHGYPLDVDEDHSYHIDVVREGEKRPVIKVTSYGPDAIIRLNVSTKPKDLERLDTKWYNYFLEHAKPLNLSYGKVPLKMRAIKPEHLVAAKLTRYAPKDMFDIHTLTNVMEDKGLKFDYEEVKKILGLECTNQQRCTKTECFEEFPYTQKYGTFLNERRSTTARK